MKANVRGDLAERKRALAYDQTLGGKTVFGNRSWSTTSTGVHGPSTYGRDREGLYVHKNGNRRNLDLISIINRQIRSASYEAKLFKIGQNAINNILRFRL